MITCEACGHQTESRLCQECQKENPADALFCCYCGKNLGEKAGTEPARTSTGGGDPYDLDNRVLCSDDTCIGIIGEDGVCTECGKRPGPE